MVQKFFLYFGVSAVSFFLFYFNTPYWTGKGMLDVTKNGIYRFLYIIASTIGFWLYQAIERITSWIIKALKRKSASLEHGIINLLLYIGCLFCLTYLYESIMSDMLGAGNADFHFTETDSYSRLSDIFLLFKVFQHFGPIDSIGTFFIILWQTLGSILFYVVGTIVHFSILYGLLTQKLLELHPIQNTVLSPLLDDDTGDSTPTNIPKQLITAVLQFIDQISLFINFKVIGILPVFFLIFAGYSGVQVWLGNEASWQDLLFELVDEMGIITILGSFLISFLVAKAVNLLCLLINDMLPESMRTKLEWLSEKGNQQVAYLQETRKAWAQKHDGIYNWLIGRIREMHLDAGL